MLKFAISTSEAGSFEECVRILRRYLRRHAIDSLLLGVSGGADSVLALHLLASAGRGLPGFRLGVAHANFHLRGEESMRDEDFVRELAEYYSADADFFFRDFATQEFARRNQISIEMAARQLRHEWWDELCRQHNYRLIATGHNADDNEETLLLNLLRGASPHGLRGMSTLGDRIFRPLLGLHRPDILRLLADRATVIRPKDASGADKSSEPGLDSRGRINPKGYVTDSTNLESEYRRNFLRNEVIPMLAERWPGVHSALQTTLRLQSESAAIIDFAIEDFLRRNNVESSGKIAYSALRQFPAPVSLIFHWLRPHGITSTVAAEIANHIPAGEDCDPNADRRADNNSSCNPSCNSSGDSDISFGRRWLLSDGSEIVTTPQGLRLTIPSSNADRHYLTADNLPLSEGNRKADWEAEEVGPTTLSKIKTVGTNEIYLPFPASEYEWRTPAEGDRLKLFPDRNGRQGTKLISDILREAGIPTADRHNVLMLSRRTDGEIIWIPGVKRSGSDLISPKNKTIYHLRICTTKI